jgi:hypothetical protein
MDTIRRAAAVYILILRDGQTGVREIADAYGYDMRGTIDEEGGNGRFDGVDVYAEFGHSVSGAC